MENTNKVDQSVLAEDVASKIPYEFLDFFLVKPLDPIKVKKEFSVPVDTTIKKDDGLEIQEYEEVSKEVKEVDSDYRRGIVLKRPLYYESSKIADPEDFSKSEIKTGDTVIFRDTAGLYFDLLKDSKLLRQYDIIGVVK